jgi:polyhydroxyalkanoate synthesis regulator phasin
LGDGFISEDEVSGLSDSLTEDGVLTEDEKELLVDVILEQADGNAISTELINELGLDYEDLPDDQPVALENGVILFAEVADALEIFSNPSEILGAVFTDPGKALTAVANIGADMTPEKREESQKVVVASVITVQVVAATNLATGRIR